MLDEAITDDIGYDPFDHDVMCDPRPYYKRLRDEQPIYYTPKYDTYWLARFDHVIEMMYAEENALISSESSIPMPEVLMNHHDGPPPLASLDPMSPLTLLHSPIYNELRMAHMKPLMRHKVEQLRQFCRDECNRMLDELLPRKKFDLFLDYAGLLSALLTCELWEIDRSEAEDIRDTVNAITMYDPDKKGIDNALFFSKLKRFQVPSIARRREAGADGKNALIDGLIHYRLPDTGRALNDDEIADILTCAFIGNTETPGKVAAQGLLELERNPDQLAEIRQDIDTNVVKATEEMLRTNAPAQWALRTVHKEITIGGVTMKPGQRVSALIACANRDEREYPDAEKFIWNREIRRQLAFGMGLHHCMGLHIARLQIQVAVAEFLKRVDNYHVLTEEGGLLPSYFHWAYNSLPVEIRD